MLRKYFPLVSQTIRREISKVSQSVLHRTVTTKVQVLKTHVVKRCRALFALLATISEGKKQRVKSKAYMVLSLISILIFRTSQRNSFLQKKLSLYLLFHRTPKTVFLMLSRWGVTLSYEASIRSLSETEKVLPLTLEKWKEERRRVMGVVDNINFTTKASEEVSGSKSQRVNSVLGFLTAMRVPNPFASEIRPRGLPTQLPTDFFLQDDLETARFTTVLTTLMARVLVECSPELADLKKIVQKPLRHAHSDETSTKTSELGIEILFLDENKNSDIPAILDYYSVILITLPLS